MRPLPWLAARADLPGIGLAVAVATVASVVVAIRPYSPLLNEIALATLGGALVINTPLRRLVGDVDRYGPGLRYVGTWIVRLSVVLLGLKLHARFFRLENLLVIGGVAFASVPSAFFVAHVAGALAKLRRPLVDVLAAGTMICGASAVNAVAPTVGATREEQGVAIGSIFVYSALAMAVLPAVAAVVGLDPFHSGLWSGLSVNDLASALAVGRMMDGDTDSSSVMSAMSKSARILLLAPSVLVFQRLRARRAIRAGAPSVPLVPGFLVGYLLLSLVRVAGDRFFPRSNEWHVSLEVADHLLGFTMATVAAAIGLSLDVRRLYQTGIRAVVVGGAASLWTAGLTLAMLWLSANRHPQLAVALGAAGLAAAYAVYRAVLPRDRRSGVEKDATTTESPVPGPAAQSVLVPALFVLAIVAGLVAMPTLRFGGATTPPRPVHRVTGACPAGMAAVPAGRFMMGSDDGFDPDETPRHEERIAAFCMDVTEASVRDYRRCERDGHCEPLPTTADWPELDWVEGAAWSRFCNARRTDRDDHPANCVNWYQADDYCRSLGRRLPTEPEWEYVARGGDAQRTYPWGEARPTPERANMCGRECVRAMTTIREDWGSYYDADDGWPTTAPVGGRLASAGRWGHLDLMGNVAEWTATPYCPYDEPDCGSDERVARGNGYATNNRRKSRNARRNHDEPWHRSPDLGVRCVLGE